MTGSACWRPSATTPPPACSRRRGRGHQARHFEFFARAVDRRPGEDEDSYCGRLRADYDNIRVALGWASRQAHPDLLLSLATRLVVFWSASTHLAEAVQWLRTATERGRDADPGLRGRALGALTQIASLALDLPVALAAGPRGWPCCASWATRKAS